MLAIAGSVTLATGQAATTLACQTCFSLVFLVAEYIWNRIREHYEGDLEMGRKEK
jgi:hypothetical protein